MGITALSNSFGPTTLSTLESRFPRLDETTVPSAIFCRILQSALYCKGYDGGEIDGVYSDRVKSAVTTMKVQMGVDSAYPGSALEPKVVKAMMTMDAYVVVNDGSQVIRSIQQWLNGRYVSRRDFFIGPFPVWWTRGLAA